MPVYRPTRPVLALATLLMCGGALAAPKGGGGGGGGGGTPVATSCTAAGYLGKVRLNEAKTQGGGSGLDFIEILVIDNGVALDGWKLGVYNFQGNFDGVGGPGPAYIALATSKGCANSASLPCAGAAQDSPGEAHDYPTFIIYKLPNMSQDSGQFVLFAPDGGVADFISYSKTASCPTLYWSAPTGTCLNTGSCLPNFGPSGADMNRQPDGSGDWQASSSSTPGASNSGGAPSGGLGYKFRFTPTGPFCPGKTQAVSIAATWVDANGDFLAGYPAYTAYAGSNFSLSKDAAGATFTPDPPTSSDFSNGATSIQLTQALAGSVNLTATHTALPGTASSQAFTFSTSACGPARFKAPYIHLREIY
jgi:hypothetical protein